MAPKRIKAHRGQAYHLGVTCGACGAECEPNAANWADATPADVHGEVAPVGPVCYSCGGFCEARRITPEQLTSSAEGARGKKRVGSQYRAECAEHLASQQNMGGRTFTPCDVWKEDISGVFTEDVTDFMAATSFLEASNRVAPADVGLDTVKRDFPGDPGRIGMLVNGSQQQEGTIVSDAPPSCDSHIIKNADGTISRVMRFCQQRVVMKDMLLDGRQEPLAC